MCGGIIQQLGARMRLVVHAQLSHMHLADFEGYHLMNHINIE